MKLSILSFLLAGALLQAQDPSSITDSISDYKALCMSAANSEKEFSHFRSNPLYQEALEICNKQLGSLFAKKIIRDYPSLISKLSLLRKNDFYGSPVTYDFPVVGRFSPATLRYISIAGDILKLFKFSQPPRIVEIGVGYGGQCFILNSVLPIEQYTLVDLPTVLPLAEKYLNRLEIKNVKFTSPDQVQSGLDYDLFISNYAFSECSRAVQLFYFEEIIRHTSRGYVLFNHISDSWGIDSLSVSEFVDLLELEGFQVTLSHEDPLTSTNNYLVVWTTSQ